MKQPDRPVYEPGDLDRPATKRDLLGLATKDELQKALAATTHAITDAVSVMLEEQRRAVRSDILEFKDDVMKELKAVRQEQAAITHHHREMWDHLDDHERFLVK